MKKHAIGMECFCSGRFSLRNFWFLYESKIKRTETFLLADWWKQKFSRIHFVMRWMTFFYFFSFFSMFITLLVFERKKNMKSTLLWLILSYCIFINYVFFLIIIYLVTSVKGIIVGDGLFGEHVDVIHVWNKVRRVIYTRVLSLILWLIFEYS